MLSILSSNFVMNTKNYIPLLINLISKEDLKIGSLTYISKETASLLDKYKEGKYDYLKNLYIEEDFYENTLNLVLNYEKPYERAFIFENILQVVIIEIFSISIEYIIDNCDEDIIKSFQKQDSFDFGWNICNEFFSYFSTKKEEIYLVHIA